MLPPQLRDLWRNDFQELKKEDEGKGCSWLYEADPFLAADEHKKVEAGTHKPNGSSIGQMREQASTVAPNFSVQTPDSRSSSGWDRAEKLNMGAALRSQVEAVLKRFVTWNAHTGASPSTTECQKMTKDLTDSGFRKAHAQEAVSQCKNRQEALEWLLVHVPEDDLPQWSMPEGYSAGATLVSGNIPKEAAIARLAQAGYSRDRASEMLEIHGSSECKAAEALQKLLCSEVSETTPSASFSLMNSSGDCWEQESEVLESIYGDRYEKLSVSQCSIKLEIAEHACCAKFQKSKTYPLEAPIISLQDAKLPSHIKLSIYRHAIQQAHKEFVDQPMIYLLVDWLQAEIPRIVNNPGRLNDIAAATATFAAGHACSPRKQASKTPRHDPLTSRQSASTDKSMSMLRQWNARHSTEAQRRMMATRQKLPAWKAKDTILQTVHECQVTIIGGPTGSGKSTQVVQFLLDDIIQKRMGEHANIICTQPRRISALGLAHRVAEERCVAVGKEVGYSIRGESQQIPGETLITFCTTGVLLRRLQNLQACPESDLAGVIVVDEVHERSLDSDLLLVLLKDILTLNKRLKVILMSATLDAGEFEEYFKALCRVGKIEIEGRAHPVTDYFLDDVIRMSGYSTSSNTAQESQLDKGPDVGKAIQRIGTHFNYELLAAVIFTIHRKHGLEGGSILVFLPGVPEINRAMDAIRAIDGIYALPLHASLTAAEQRKVFLPAPRDQRKVVISTNVAETSITIPDCVFVIDSGLVKQTAFDPERGMVKLQQVLASKAACQQRRGRAGRVRAGECYKLFTRAAEAKMPLQPVPEIQRVSLEQVCLSVRAMGRRDVAGFLAKALTVPEASAIESALALLRAMGALDGEDLTALGRHLASVPADLRCGKLMIYGALFKCFEACLTIAAILTVSSPFVQHQAKKTESTKQRTSFSSGNGDLAADLAAYNEWSAQRKSRTSQQVRSWCEQNFLSYQTLSEISLNCQQYLATLKELGFIPLDYSASSGCPSASYVYFNSNGASLGLLRALIAGAFAPQIARIAFPDKKYAASSSGAVELDPEARSIKYYTQDVGRVFVHPGSTLFEARSFPGNSRYIAWFRKMATSKVFIRDLTPFNAYSLLLFAGNVQLDLFGRGLVVDEWLRLRGWARIGVLVGRLRALLDEVLEASIQNPGELDEKGYNVIRIVQKLVEFDGQDR